MTPVRPDTRKDYHERLNRVLVHIDQHRSETLSLESLAAVACLSPSHFHRIFRAFVGEPVGQYVQRTRLEAAAGLVLTTSRSMLEIAMDVGYESAAAFSRAFVERFGMAPSECRKSHQLELQVRAAQLQDTSMNPTIVPQIRERADTRVAFIRHTGPYAQVGQAWCRLCGQLGAAGKLGPATVYIGIGHDSPQITPEDKIRYDACATIDAQFQPSAELGVQTIPGGRYAVFLHRGPYEGLNATYDQIFRDWLPTSQESVRDQPAFELYLNSPDQTAPADLRTEIWVPLAG